MSTNFMILGAIDQKLWEFEVLAANFFLLFYFFGLDFFS
jgi:hypothetical protein